MSNWAPVFDFELVNMSAWGHGSGTAERDRVFACTGRGDHGAITELRYGIQASTHEPVDYLQGVRRLFILPDASSRGYFVLSSLADQSFLCYRSAGRDGEWFECEGALSLEFEEATLAAGPLELGVDEPALWSVQVTPSAITVAQLSEEYTLPKQEPDSMGDGEGRRRLQRRCDGGDTIIAAAIHGKFVLIALRNGFAITLILAVISIKPDRYAPQGLQTVEY